MTVPWNIVVASSNCEVRQALVEILQQQGIEPICATTMGECMEILSKDYAGLVFCDRNLIDGNYHDLLAISKSMNPRVRIVVTTHRAEWDDYLEAVRFGAFDVISAPCLPADVEWMIIQAKRDERNRLKQPISVEPRSETNHTSTVVQQAVSSAPTVIVRNR